MTSHFVVQNIQAGSGRSERVEFPLTPSGEGEKVCGLFGEFLADHPAGFRERLPFVNKGDWELEWAAARGGSAFAVFHESGQVLSMLVLLSGVEAEADNTMLGSFLTSPLGPVFAGNPPDLARPLLLYVQFPEHAQIAPAAQLMATALASVYFRAVLGGTTS